MWISTVIFLLLAQLFPSLCQNNEVIKNSQLCPRLLLGDESDIPYMKQKNVSIVSSMIVTTSSEQYKGRINILDLKLIEDDARIANKTQSKIVAVRWSRQKWSYEDVYQCDEFEKFQVHTRLRSYPLGIPRNKTDNELEIENKEQFFKFNFKGIPPSEFPGPPTYLQLILEKKSIHLASATECTISVQQYTIFNNRSFICTQVQLPTQFCGSYNCSNDLKSLLKQLKRNDDSILIDLMAPRPIVNFDNPGETKIGIVIGIGLVIVIVGGLMMYCKVKEQRARAELERLEQVMGVRRDTSVNGSI